MKKKLLYIFLFAFLLRICLSFLVWHGDLKNHMDWGIRFWEYGPLSFYASKVWSFTWPNQPPGTIYMFAASRKLFEWAFSLIWFVNVKVPIFPSGVVTYFEGNLYPAFLKLPAILADLGIAYLIYNFFAGIRKNKMGILGAGIFLFNPVIWYNSALWGQTDSVVNFFALLSFILLLRKRLAWAVLALTVSFYIKASLLIFAPAFLILVLRQKYEWKKIITALLISLAFIAFVTLPFSGGEPFSWLWGIYSSKVFTQQLQIITANAFNVWAAIVSINARPQSLLLGPFTYQFWGILLFSFFYIPSLYIVFKKQDAKTVFWSLTTAAFSSFMFLTNMHERYLYPFFPVFTILAVWEGLLPLYFIVSGINLLNIYNFWFVPRIDFLVSFLSFNERIMPRILGLIDFGAFLYFYRLFLRHKRSLRL